MSREIWDIYNIHGERQQRTILRGEPLQAGDYHLVVQIWIKNEKGEFLIQQRSENVKTSPGIWATTAGSVVAGEDSLTAAIRELREELGIEVAANELHLITQTIKEDSLWSVWLLTRDIPLHKFTLQEVEVSQIRWTRPEKIKQMVAEGLFYDYGNNYFSQIFA